MGGGQGHQQGHDQGAPYHSSFWWLLGGMGSLLFLRVGVLLCQSQQPSASIDRSLQAGMMKQQQPGSLRPSIGLIEDLEAGARRLRSRRHGSIVTGLMIGRRTALCC